MRRAGPVKGARTGLVLAHGRGGSAEDILGLLNHAGLPDVAAIAPEAPGGSWWPTSFLALTAMGAEVVAQVYPGAGHSVMPEDVERLRLWLNR